MKRSDQFSIVRAGRFLIRVHYISLSMSQHFECHVLSSFTRLFQIFIYLECHLAHEMDDEWDEWNPASWSSKRVHNEQTKAESGVKQGGFQHPKVAVWTWPMHGLGCSSIQWVTRICCRSYNQITPITGWLHYMSVELPYCTKSMQDWWRLVHKLMKISVTSDGIKVYLKTAKMVDTIK